MATYDYKCSKCDVVKEIVHSMSESPNVVCDCGTVMERQVGNSFGGFMIKGGTPTTHWREKRMRTQRSQELGLKQQQGASPKIAPNVAGHRTDTWSDAQKLAKEAGMNTASYQPYVDKEKKTKISVVSAGTPV